LGFIPQAFSIEQEVNREENATSAVRVFGARFFLILWQEPINRNKSILFLQLQSLFTVQPASLA
jgi:hypothetical protein